jgi:hypothetical protein
MPGFGRMHYKNFAMNVMASWDFDRTIDSTLGMTSAR